ncbi:MAG TPA: cobalamin-dependent protein [Anaeromyxobacteraceae bacterium]|nr:cobalamin-dependent protein [Anaeromyxobacteraceae bacterium]
MTAAQRERLIALCVELDEGPCLDLVASLLGAQEDPLAIIEAVETGMHEVGERFAQGEYFISGLIMAGEIFREVLALVQPAMEDARQGNARGRVLLGTAEGDIHDIGKSIVAVALRSHGFTVDDLGVNVPPGTFAARALELRPDIIGVSGLLTTSYDSMRATVEVLRADVAPSYRPLPVIIGGGTLSEDVRRYVGADYCVRDALSGVHICERIVAG